MKQAFNPYLPSYEYIPDGEPHVFGDRVYIYGSHDRFGGKKFCLNHYVCYSAPVAGLTDWKYEGVIYRNNQDSRMTQGGHELWVPDAVQGKDGRYYLYYCADDTLPEIGVAVCDSPAGNYEFLGLVHDKTGTPIGDRKGDTIQFDPGIFIDDDGTIYLFSGNGPRTRGEIGKKPKASVVMTLADDMVTIQTEPKKLLPVLGEADGTGFEGHEFFEASSIRKINGKYYLVYSSVNLHELCYAVSGKPDGEYEYGGVIVSNADIFPNTSRNRPMNCYGNNHGGIERINGAWYIFYHRQTNRTMFSRQGCAEKINIAEDGSIKQVEITSCGLNGKPLEGKGEYPAHIVCNLFGKYKPAISHPLAMGNRHPYLTQNGADYDPDSNDTPPVQYIANGKNGMTVVFKYFSFHNLEKITVRARGKASGTLKVSVSVEGETVGEIPIEPSRDWKTFESGDIDVPDGEHSLYFTFRGKGKLDFLSFTLM
jgi:hypothetical protein